jgi:AAA+ superfamily predicted ATPase
MAKRAQTPPEPPEIDEGPAAGSDDGGSGEDAMTALAQLQWRFSAAAALPDPERGFADASAQLLAETLRVHGRLLEHLAGGPPAAGELSAALFGARVAAAEAAALARGVALPLPSLVRRLSLSDGERELLLLCVARAVSPALRLLLAHAQRPFEWDHVSVVLATELIGGGELYAPPPLDLLAPDRPLFADRLLQLEAPTRQATHQLGDQMVIANEALVTYLQGRLAVPLVLRGLATILEHPQPLSEAVLDDLTRHELAGVAAALPRYLAFVAAADAPDGPDFAARAFDGLLGIVSGPPGCGKSVAVEGLAAAAGRPLLRVSAARVATQPRPEELVDAAFSHAALTGAVLCFDRAHALFRDAGAPLAALLEGMRRHRGPTVLETSEPTRLNLDIEARLLYHVGLRKPSPRERRALWEKSLAPAALPRGGGEADLHHLSIHYELSGAKVKHAVASSFFEAARRDPAGAPALVVTPPDLEEAARKQAAQRLDLSSGARSRRLTLKDIVLQPDTEKAIREMVDACRYRMSVLADWGFGERISTGKGIVALFMGEPGTGKSWCAEIVASELGLNTFAVSIPHVMSKWVGETEKNISRVFAQARAQNALIVFDEADALFTKRVKVESASDRFSNMEVNHLLQELDKSEGLAILTSNLAATMDRAFQRRVGFHIKFPMPDADERRRIWETLLPPEAPLGDDVDFDELARWYEFSGGLIKNTLLRAAYRARSLGRAIDLELLHLAAEEECRAAGKPWRRPDTW